VPSLFDIARSGVQSYRQALAVTGQNIANINTDGYKRREAGLTEVSSGQGGITQIQDGTGLGVRVEEIKRSFDAYLLDRKRNSFSREETATNFLDKISELEDLLLPGEADLGSSMGLFFSSLQEVAASPADVAARVVAVEEGKNVAATFSRTSDVLAQLKKGAKSHAQQQIDSVNILTNEILNVNSKLLSSSTQGGAANALLDNRDRLIDELSKTLEVTVSYTGKNAAIVRLGGSGSGPKIVEESKRIAIGLDEESTDIKVILGPGTLNSPTNQITNGAMRGLIDASQTIEQTLKDLDSLAQKFVQEMNNQHKNGLTLDGLKGKDMFTSVGFASTQNPTNMGNTTASASAAGGGLVNPDPIKLIYSETREEWIGYDLSNNEIGSGLTSISTRGINITLLGTATDGDEITISPSNSFAKDMEFSLRRPDDIAASASFLISADTKNLSDASISADSTGTILDTNLAKVSRAFTNSLSPISATTFLNDGFAASIPKATEAIQIASFSKQSALQFTLSTSDLSQASQLSFSVGGVSYNFDLAYGDVFKTLTGNPLSETSASGAWEDSSEIAKYLNLGELRSGNITLESLGIFASGNAGNLTLSLASGDFATSATITAGASTISAIRQSSEAASNIQIFTREGRHIAGSPLTKLEKSTFMSTANGFSDQAVYNAEYLNLNEPVGYRGLNLERMKPAGTFSIPLGGNGVGRKAQLGLGSLPASSTSSAYELNLYFPDLAGDTLSTNIPAGSSAKFAANQINTTMSDLGIRAKAKNRIELYNLSGNGEVSFDIESRNQKPINITTSTTATDLTALYETLNQQSSQIGVNVYLSNDKSRIVMESLDGEDISFSSFSSSSGLTMKSRFVDENSIPIGSDTAVMHSRGDTDPVTLGSYLVQNNSGVVSPISVNAGQMNIDGTISAGNTHGLRVGDTIILNQKNAGETTTGVSVSSLSDTNSGSITGTLYYVKSINAETGAFKLATGSATGSDVILTPGGAETTNSHSLTFYQVKLIDAGRFGGLLNLEGASSFQSVVTGGATSTATADPMDEGLINRSATATGEKQTISFNINEQIDFNAADTQGLAASAAAAKYGLDVNFIDTSLASEGTAFSASVNSASLKEQTKSALSKAMANSLRESAPISSIKGVTVATKPDDGSSLTVTFNGQNYLLTMVNGEVVVTGGEADRVSAYFEAVSGGGHALKVTAPDGVLTGAQFSVPTTVSGNSDAATLFGMTPATVTKTIIGRSVNFTPGTVNAAFPIKVNGTAENITITTTSGNSVNDATTGNATFLWVDDTGGNGHLQITITGDSTALEFENNSNAEAIGLKTAEILAYVKGEELEFETLNGQVLDIDDSASAPMSSLASENFTITNLPPEELIILVNGGGARKIAANFDSNPPALEEITPELTIKVTNDAGNVIDILDKATGHSIATRQLDTAGAADALGFLFKIDGRAVKDDIFNFSANSGGVGDNRNISAVIELQREKNGKGGFQQIFSNLVSKVGSQVKSGKLNVEAAEAMRAASEEAEAQFSGVNLDSQAAALIEFQQAYQASARILQTARELFQTLIDTV
jgi:flagellar hook-associated protein FlgK|tara:strand:- start:894 stop:5582 length:4689 start_codon:yes stop_codon:yes gene_type:complete